MKIATMPTTLALLFSLLLLLPAPMQAAAPNLVIEQPPAGFMSASFETADAESVCDNCLQQVSLCSKGNKTIATLVTGVLAGVVIGSALDSLNGSLTTAEQTKNYAVGMLIGLTFSYTSYDMGCRIFG